MKAFFSTLRRLLDLHDIAATWIGTPFVPNARIKRGGVSCQMLAAEIYRECGALTGDEADGVPEGPMDWSNANNTSLIEAWLDDMPHRFAPVERPWKPGDLIGFRLGGCLHHLGVDVGGGRMIHCLRPDGVRYNRIDDATYLKRISRIWRPIE